MGDNIKDVAADFQAEQEASKNRQRRDLRQAILQAADALGEKRSPVAQQNRLVIYKLVKQAGEHGSYDQAKLKVNQSAAKEVFVLSNSGGQE
ncbi:MAG: hypothetical protein K6L75_02545 [Cellvibrionaceae bacterium]